MTWLVQMLLPVAGRQKTYDSITRELTERFGGASASAHEIRTL